MLKMGTVIEADPMELDSIFKRKRNLSVKKTIRKNMFQQSGSFISWLVIRPFLRFLLGSSFGAAFTVALLFFPFPKGKIYSYSVAPLVLILALLLERYTRCSPIVPVTMIKMFKGKVSVLVAITVYFSMYLGALYVTDAIRQMIKQSKEEEKEQMSIFMEKVFLSLNETIQSRLQQSFIITCLFYFIDNRFIRLFLFLSMFIWIPTLPELNPVLALGWYQTSTKFTGQEIAHFFVNMYFLVACCIGISWIIQIVLYCIRWGMNKRIEINQKNKNVHAKQD